ncbi:hypothetical protein ACIBBE_24675 [Streptomyces sp. NPDC051644]|uniref:hypothetical protein n=1 Tax=Streptomyces sp. NPDC051644 TaxID=3365666 RepID=UPI0037B25B38
MDTGPAADDHHDAETRHALRRCGDAIGLEAARKNIPADLYVALFGRMQEGLLRGMVHQLGDGEHTIQVFTDLPGDPLVITAPTAGRGRHLGPDLARAVFLLLAAHGPSHSAGITARTVHADGHATLQGWVVLDGAPKPLSADVLRTLCSLGAQPSASDPIHYADAFTPTPLPSK